MKFWVVEIFLHEFMATAVWGSRVKVPKSWKISLRPKLFNFILIMHVYIKVGVRVGGLQPGQLQFRNNI